MKIRTNSNVMSGFIFMIISAVLYILIPTQIKTFETSEINAQTIPRLVISMIFVFSILLIITGWKKEKKEVIINAATFKSAAFKRELKTLCFISFLFIYALIFEFVGFIISSLLLTTAVLLYYKVRKKSFYLIAWANVGIIYVVFGMILNVRFP